MAKHIVGALLKAGFSEIAISRPSAEMRTYKLTAGGVTKDITLSLRELEERPEEALVQDLSERFQKLVSEQSPTG